MKNIIVEIEYGMVKAVYCPDKTYVVNVLDRDDQNSEISNEMHKYYSDLEEEIEHLKNCF